MRLDTHQKSYADLYLQGHKQSGSQQYRMDYWNHFFLDSLLNTGKQNPTHLLEEGGGTCGIWKSLSFDRYTSVDLSEAVTEAAHNLYQGDASKELILGDIFAQDLIPSAYNAIIANAYGLYYRPDLARLERFYHLLAENGFLFIAIDPILKMKHRVVAPIASLIDRHVRPYSRVSSRSFEQMLARTGFQVWQTIDYTPAPGWKRRAYILQKRP